MKPIRAAVVCLAAVLAAISPSYGQNVTTGSLTGVVRDAQGGVLPGVTITATHTPTGTMYEGVTAGDGTFNVVNVRIGGPYEIGASLPGFREGKETGVNVNLGQSTSVDITLQLAAVTETVTVTAVASSVFTATNSGTSANIEQAVIEGLPTIQRSLTDFARANPFFAPSNVNANSGTVLSVAGRSGRYNNLQIDGAVNNDLFGVNDSGLPGGTANTEPISLGAIQELQLVVSPYDVRQGNFSGGGVNAITKSGTNSLRGEVLYVFRNEDWVGYGVDNRKIATFSDKQFGGSIGGPIAQNRAFYFANVEWQRRETPTGWSVDGSSGQAFGRQAEIERVLSIAQTRYGYNPGGITEFIRLNPNNKVFARGDFNLSGGHQLTVRHNYIDAVNDVGTISNTRYLLPDQLYSFSSVVNSTVGQLNSTFGRMANEARVTYQRVRDVRNNREEPFPQVNIRMGGGQDVRFGTDQFSSRNRLDQDIIEINDDITVLRGQHTFTFGTHNELFKFYNLFIRDNFGTYDFNSIDLFEQGLAQQFIYRYSQTSDPLQAANFWVFQLGFYAGDVWRVRRNLTLTYGVRVDAPIFPDTPLPNPQVSASYGMNTDVVPSSSTWAPRIGANWDLSTDSVQQQLRFGTGLFGGRTPYVWLSNQYTNTGNEFSDIDSGFNANNRLPFFPDALDQPEGVARANEINLIDPEYNYPRLLRGNVGYDRSLAFGLIGTVELLFSQTLQDIDYKNLNLGVAGQRPDGRPFYTQFPNAAFRDVVLLTNTTEGSSWTVATKLEKPFRSGWYAQGSYLYGESNTVNDGGSSQARSNWVNNYFGASGVNDVPVAMSNFSPGHRITLSAIYTRPFGPTEASFSAYYNGQTGRPY
ncbi:MAG TPA: carboxypeptidase regulatory-like domain-containing protein, partial [Vicinamibacterales bacterium]|nr:carboxypeptidase regulatory-like domain-containing protein [Vicinamibacterales bacterium]